MLCCEAMHYITHRRYNQSNADLPRALVRAVFTRVCIDPAIVHCSLLSVCRLLESKLVMLMQTHAETLGED